VSLSSRRELLAGGLGFGVVSAVLAAPADAVARSRAASELADAQRDLQVLEGLMSAEQLIQYCYTQVLESQALKSAANDIVLVALGHAESHAAAIQAGITTVKRRIAGLQLALPPVPGGPARHSRARHPQPNPPPQVVELFKTLRHEGYCVIQLIRIEGYVTSRYFHAVAEVSEPQLVRTVTQILACKGQQWSLFRNLLSHGRVMETVPSATVRGSATLPK
jgi:D-serine deaminase-like pyridoxal phosphate-dependent protein